APHPTPPPQSQSLSLHDALPISQNNGNDYAWFRLGEILLIKAEALNELTPGDPTALALVNQLRARPKETVAPALAGPITRDLIRSEEHTSELQSHLISYAVFCLQ